MRITYKLLYSIEALKKKYGLFVGLEEIRSIYVARLASLVRLSLIVRYPFRMMIYNIDGADDKNWAIRNFFLRKSSL